MRYMREALEKPALRDAVADLLHSTVFFLSQARSASRVLLGRGSARLWDRCGAQPTGDGRMRKAGEETLRKRFVMARRAGDLPKGISPADFARFVATVMPGLAVQAVNRVSRDEMKRTADLALKAIRLG